MPKLPTTGIPEPVLPGVRSWLTRDGWTVVRLHYSADPERATPQWIKEISTGYRGGTEGRDWQREMELDASSFPGEPVYSLFPGPAAVRTLSYNPEIVLWRGWDFGYRHPACVWLQYDAKHDVLHHLYELFPTEDRESLPGITTPDFVRMVLAVTKERFPDADDPHRTAGVIDYVDPAGNQTKETSDYSSIEWMQQFGLEPLWSVVGRKNRISYAREYVERPGKFWISSLCPLSITALSSAYRYPVAKGGTVDREMPDLGKQVQEEPYIHLMDAFEYVVGNTLQADATYLHKPVKQGERDDGVASLVDSYLNIETEKARMAQQGRDPLTRWRPPHVHDEADTDLWMEDLVGAEDDADDAWLIR